jgi:hypothetical protein
VHAEGGMGVQEVAREELGQDVPSARVQGVLPQLEHEATGMEVDP